MFSSGTKDLGSPPWQCFHSIPIFLGLGGDHISTTDAVENRNSNGYLIFNGKKWETSRMQLFAWRYENVILILIIFLWDMAPMFGGGRRVLTALYPSITVLVHITGTLFGWRAKESRQKLGRNEPTRYVLLALASRKLVKHDR
ncbi:hypothetical protein BKA82DRAFT_2455689 [Pisolithus tinctorius]|nr:hypothetical protein BKA82DRAFT_2455689 [Pisolithus tinctorius]